MTCCLSHLHKITSTRQQNNGPKDYDEDKELSAIITKIEGEHILTMFDDYQEG